MKETKTGIWEMRGPDKNNKWWCKVCKSKGIIKGHHSLASHRLHVIRMHKLEV